MASARLFRDANFSGNQLLIDNPGHARYLLATFGFLNELNFNDRVSSVRLRSNAPAIPSMCLLFQHARFAGDFQAFAYNGARDLASLPGFNDRTSSVLLVDHSTSPDITVIRLRALGGDRINDAIDEQLSSDNRVRRRGDVRLKFVIDLFEVSRFGEDLMLLEIPIRISTQWPFGDYSAEIRYWIKFFVNAKSELQAAVVAWGYWIEGGLLTGSIEGDLRPKVQDNIGAVESQLNSMLLELNWHHWTDVYLMPGSAGQPPDDYSGNVDDECSLVLPYADE